MVGFIIFRFDKFSINLDPKEKENNSHGKSRFKIANRFKIEVFFFNRWGRLEYICRIKQRNSGGREVNF